MKKRILSLALSLSLAISLFAPAYAAETKPVTPTAPEWIKAEDYLIFPDDQVYLPENWAEVEALRNQARSGATTVTDIHERDLFDITLKTPSSAGWRYEVALAWLKCAENAGLTGETAEKAFREACRYFSCAGDGWKRKNKYELDELYYRLLLQDARAHLLGYTYTSESSIYEAVTNLGMTMDDLYDAPHMELITPERRYAILNDVGVYCAENGYPVPPSPAGDIQIFLDGLYVGLDVPAAMVNGRTMIPIRAVAEALGADVGWEEATRQVTLTRAGTTIVMTVDSTAATVNGEAITMDVAPYISGGGRTLIPVRYVAEFFGQKVDWDGENLRVYISEDKSVVGNSNLEAWALPMGSMLSWMHSDTDPNIFGSRLRSAQAVSRRRNDLSSGWSISSREELINTVISMTFYGHDATFRSMAADVKLRSEEERKEISAASDAWPYFMWAYTEELEEKWGDRGIMAWDLFRMSNILQWGYVAGYVTYEEALALLEPAATILRENFSSWDEAYENYLDGYTWWARTSAEEWAKEVNHGKGEYYNFMSVLIEKFRTQEGWQDWMVVPRGTNYYQIKVDPQYAGLFDDSLFETGVIGVPEK